ncbi:MAG TPA: serine/threonine-protein kinase [Gemmatimonadales bacterium]|nr:serine/threonine-protein kinase [Gemmatimonadales bacterium]
MPPENLVGRTLAGYRLIAYVGEGGTATVYRAEHPDSGAAAVKVLRERLSQDPVAVKRFLREAEFGTRVAHPNVVRTFGFGQGDGRYYMALEWAEGETLADFITKSGPVVASVAATIVEQVGAALTAAHRAGIIHRDLKPANIMYEPSSRTAKLLDFGIARDAELPAEERLTRAGFFVGTLQYVAPEALSGELVHEQADVFSLATIAYHMLTNVLPFAGKTPRELFQQLLTQPAIPLNQAVKGLTFPDELAAVVMKGLARDLGERWKTVEEFAGAFVAAARAEGAQRKKGFLASIFGKGE